MGRFDRFWEISRNIQAGTGVLRTVSFKIAIVGRRPILTSVLAVSVVFLARNLPLVSNPRASLYRVHVGWNSRPLFCASPSSSGKTVSLCGWRSILPFDRIPAIFHESLVRLIDGPWRCCGCKAQQLEHVLDRAEFKDTIQLRQLKYALDPVHD